MKAILFSLLMITIVSAAPQFQNPSIIGSEEVTTTRYARQVNPLEYAATMSRTGELPLAELKADYPLPGTPEYAAMMLARSSATAGQPEKVESKTDYPAPGTPEYAAMMLARTGDKAFKDETKIDPKLNPAEYARMMQRQQSVAAQARSSPVEIDPVTNAAMMAYQHKKEAQARIDPPTDSIAYAEMMAYQQNADPKSDPSYYPSMMLARSGEQQQLSPERFLAGNLTQLISIVQTAVKQEMNSTITILTQMKNNLTNLINNQKQILRQQQQAPLTVFVKDQQPSSSYPYYGDNNYHQQDQKQQPVYIFVRPGSPSSLSGSSRPFYSSNHYNPELEFFFNNRRYEKQVIAADDVDY